MNEEIKSKIAGEIAKQLPSEVVVEIVKGAVESAIESMDWETRDIQNLVQQAIIDRAKELLKTQLRMK